MCNTERNHPVATGNDPAPAVKTYIVVHKERTFGYCHSLPSPIRNVIRLSVLAVQVLKGGDPFHLNHDIIVDGKNLRLATRKDFDEFKISVKGFDTDAYVWDKTPLQEE